MDDEVTGWGGVKEGGKEGEPIFIEHLLYAGSEPGWSHTAHLFSSIVTSRKSIIVYRYGH